MAQATTATQRRKKGHRPPSEILPLSSLSPPLPSGAFYLFQDVVRIPDCCRLVPFSWALGTQHGLFWNFILPNSKQGGFFVILFTDYSTCRRWEMLWMWGWKGFLTWIYIVQWKKPPQWLKSGFLNQRRTQLFWSFLRNFCYHSSQDFLRKMLFLCHRKKGY